MPSGEWDWDHYGPNVSFVGDDPEEFLVGIDVRPGAFERDAARQCIFDISWLQSRSAAAKHRKEWKLFEKLDDSREESVVWPEHHGRADEERVEQPGLPVHLRHACEYKAIASGDRHQFLKHE
jgi:hypothetical protein